MKCLIFEEDILLSPQETIGELYAFLDLEADFIPKRLNSTRNKRWGCTHLWLNHHLGSWYGLFNSVARRFQISSLLDVIDLIKVPKIQEEEIEYPQALYFPEKENLENLLNRHLNSWRYSN